MTDVLDPGPCAQALRRDFVAAATADDAVRARVMARLPLAEAGEDTDFNHVVSVLRRLLDFPVGLVTLLSGDSQILAAGYGLDLARMARRHAICNAVLASRQAVAIEDLSRDARFSDNPFVHGPMGLRAYAGAPILAEDGVPIGALCVLDTQPRRIPPDTIETLEVLAEWVTVCVRQRLTNADLRHALARVSEHGRRLRQQGRELLDQKIIFDAACELAQLGAFSVDMDTGETEFSRSIYGLYDLPANQPPAIEPLLACVSEEVREELLQAARRVVASEDRLNRTLKIQTRAGKFRWMKVNLQRLESMPEGRHVVGVVQDVTEHRKALRRAEYLAIRDPLTRLYNRAYLDQCGPDWLSKVQGSGGRAVALMDLDDFKSINDVYGHAVGDACLRLVARRLQRTLGRSAVLARPGGDEFVMLIGLDDEDRLARALDRVVAAFKAPVEVHGHSFEITPSIGVANVPANGAVASLQGLVQNADLAMYEAKRDGGNRWVRFQEGFKTSAVQRDDRLRDVRLALREDRMVLHYQPKFDVRTGHLRGMEALLRMVTADGYLKTPEGFLSALHDRETSRRIAHLVLNVALDQAAAWRDAGLQFGHVAINLAESQFDTPGLFETVMDGLATRRLDPSSLQVEMTETILVSRRRPEIQATLAALRQAGIRVALDDFGTGNSSLVHLRDLEFDIVKIDRSFVRGLSDSLENQSIVRALVSLSRDLGKETVAEGIETDDDFAAVRKKGCDVAQGFLLARPMPAAQMVTVLSGLRGAM